MKSRDKIIIKPIALFIILIPLLAVSLFFPLKTVEAG